MDNSNAMEEVVITIPRTELLYLRDILKKIENPCVFWSDDSLSLAQQALKSAISHATLSIEMLNRWVGL